MLIMFLYRNMKVVVQRCYIIYYWSMVELLVSNKFYAMLILHSHKNGNVLTEWQLLRWKQTLWSSSRLNWTKYKKWNVSSQHEPHTLFKMSQSILMKRGKGNMLGVFLSTADSYVIITNILKTIDSEEQ